MRALIFLGFLAGAGYASCIWLVAQGHEGPLPLVAIGGVGLAGLFVWTMYDALIGGLRDKRSR